MLVRSADGTAGGAGGAGASRDWRITLVFEKGWLADWVAQVR